VALASGGTLLLAAKLNALSWSSTSGFALRLSFLNLIFAALLVLTLLLGTSAWSFVVNIRVLKFFGKISYGLYLVHMICFYMYENLAQRYWPSLAASDGHFGCLVLQFLCAGLLAIVVAALSRRYFEEYFLRLRDRSIRETEEPSEGKLPLVQTCDFNATAC
jgi:peptidoglycan/LPS O-acetylase OafA/YrhL